MIRKKKPVKKNPLQNRTNTVVVDPENPLRAGMTFQNQFRRRVFSDEELKAVEHLCKLGATNKQIAAFFGVKEMVVEEWGRKHPNFYEARRRGTIEADMKVAQSLYKRATGYSYVETEFVAVTDPVTGRKISMDEMVMVKKTKKTLPSETKAAIFWLKSRQKGQWAHAPEMTHLHVGKIEHMHNRLQEIPVEDLSVGAQAIVFELAQKQMIMSEMPDKEASND